MADNKNPTDTLEAIVAELEKVMKSGRTGRRDELLRKASAGQSTVDENAELARILAGTEGSLSTDLNKSMGSAGNKTFEDAFVINDYLEAFHKSLTGSLDTVAKRVETESAQREQHDMVFAKALIDLIKGVETLAKNTKANTDTLQSFGRQPVQGAGNQARPNPAAGTVERPVAGNQASGGTQTTIPRAVLLNTLTDMAIEKGGGAVSADGTRFDHAVAALEAAGGQISESLLQEVVEYRKSKGQAQAAPARA